MNSLRKSSMESCGTFNCLLKSSMALRWLLAPLPSSLPLVLQLPLAGREEPPGSPQQRSGLQWIAWPFEVCASAGACLGCVLVTSRCAAGADGAACGTELLGGARAAALQLAAAAARKSAFVWRPSRPRSPWPLCVASLRHIGPRIRRIDAASVHAERERASDSTPCAHALTRWRRRRALRAVRA